MLPPPLLTNAWKSGPVECEGGGGWEGRGEPLCIPGLGFTKGLKLDF